MKSIDTLKIFILIFFLLLSAGGTSYLFMNTPKERHLTKHALPAYHLITADDLITTTTPLADWVSDLWYRPATYNELLNHYTRSPLPAGKTIPQTGPSLPVGQIVPSANHALVTNTIPVSIPATAQQTMNGQLRSGSLVTLWSITTTNTPPATLLIEQALTLDVQPVEQSSTESSSPPYLIVLAIPAGRQAEILALAEAGTLALTLAP